MTAERLFLYRIFVVAPLIASFPNFILPNIANTIMSNAFSKSRVWLLIFQSFYALRSVGVCLLCKSILHVPVVCSCCGFVCFVCVWLCVSVCVRVCVCVLVTPFITSLEQSTIFYILWECSSRRLLFHLLRPIYFSIITCFTKGNDFS